MTSLLTDQVREKYPDYLLVSAKPCGSLLAVFPPSKPAISVYFRCSWKVYLVRRVKGSLTIQRDQLL